MHKFYWKNITWPVLHHALACYPHKLVIAFTSTKGAYKHRSFCTTTHADTLKQSILNLPLRLELLVAIFILLVVRSLPLDYILFQSKLSCFLLGTILPKKVQRYWHCLHWRWPPSQGRHHASSAETLSPSGSGSGERSPSQHPAAAKSSTLRCLLVHLYEEVDKQCSRCAYTLSTGFIKFCRQQPTIPSIPLHFPIWNVHLSLLWR